MLHCHMFMHWNLDMDVKWIVSFYNGEIYVDHLSYIPIFYIVILCYSIFFLGAKILTQNNARCQLYLWKNHIGCQKVPLPPNMCSQLADTLWLLVQESKWVNITRVLKANIEKKKDPYYPRFRVSYAIGVEWKKGWK